jgi:hypothetical protein
MKSLETYWSAIALRRESTNEQSWIMAGMFNDASLYQYTPLVFSYSRIRDVSNCQFGAVSCLSWWKIVATCSRSTSLTLPYLTLPFQLHRLCCKSTPETKTGYSSKFLAIYDHTSRLFSSSIPGFQLFGSSLPVDAAVEEWLVWLVGLARPPWPNFVAAPCSFTWTGT